MRRWPAALAALALAIACQDATGTGSLTAEWSTTDTSIGNGGMKLPVHGRWCAVAGQLALLGIRADSGVGILIRTDAIRPGDYVILDTTASRSPAAVMALRLIRSARLVMLSSDSGSLSLTASSNESVAGTYQAWFREPGTGTLVQVRGAFAGVRPASDSATCRAAPAAAQPADSVVF